MWKKMVVILVSICILFLLTACGQKKCATGCGNAADPDCMADMCDSCCDYWSGLNGCYRDH